MKFVLILGVVAVLGAALVAGAFVYYDRIANPRVTSELHEDPHGARAQKVMLLTLPSGRRVPVNYLREDDRVYAGGDGRWWKELVGEGGPVRLWIRGETLTGRGRAVLDDPEYTKSVFARLRPNAIPGFGTLVEIQLDEPGTEANPEAPATR
jgi:hypothetical protein